MRFLQTIENLQGENLTSAVLGYLVMRSQDLRQAFVKVLSDKSPRGPLYSEYRFGCVRESSMPDAQGRPDLLIELDDVDIIIENKLNASFQEGQPAKYLRNPNVDQVQGSPDTSTEVTTSSADSRGSAREQFVVLLVPASRKDEAKKQCDDLEKDGRWPHFKGRWTVVEWESLLAALDAQRSTTDETSRVIVQQLREYYDATMSFLPDSCRLAPDLRRSMGGYLSSVHFDFVAILKTLFDNPGRLAGSRHESGTHYYGFLTHHDKYRWLGLIVPPPGNEESTRENDVVLFVAMKEGEEKDTNVAGMDWFKCFPPTGIGWEYFGYNKYFIIDFDESWTTAQKWREKLAPLIEVRPN